MRDRWPMVMNGISAINVLTVVGDVLRRDWSLTVFNGVAAAVCFGLTWTMWRTHRGIQSSAQSSAGVSGTTDINARRGTRGGTATSSFYFTSTSTITFTTAGTGASPSREVVVADAIDDFAVGWREWRISYAEERPTVPRLHARYIERDGEWSDAGWTRARCVARSLDHPADGAAPVVGCECGLYVYSDWRVAQIHCAAPFFDTSTETGSVIGVVQAKGRIVEHGTVGFRAEYARPLAISRALSPSLAQLIAEAYEIPLLPLREMQQYAGRFGRNVLEKA